MFLTHSIIESCSPHKVLSSARTHTEAHLVESVVIALVQRLLHHASLLEQVRVDGGAHHQTTRHGHFHVLPEAAAVEGPNL